MNNRNIYIIVPFMIIVLFFNIATLLTPDKTKSDSENRNLAKAPTAIDLQNGTFASKYEKYFNDQIVLRERFVHLSVLKDMLFNKTNINGKYIIDKKYILEEPKIKYKDSDIEDAAKKVSKFCKDVDSLGKEFTYIMVPRKTTIQQELMPYYLNGQSSEFEKADTFLKILNSNNVHYINVMNYFKENFNQYQLKELYFRTDHHWNSKGAYEAFKYIINSIAEDKSEFQYNVEDADYETTIVKNIKFLGSLNRPLFLEVPYETEVPYVHLKGDSSKEYLLLENGKLNKVDERKIIANKVNTSDFLTYAQLYTNDLSYYKVINSNYKIDKKLIIFKDSYENSMTWLISDLFKEVEVVDLRHTGKKTALDFVKQSNADMVWIMYNNRNLYGDIFKLC